MKMKSLALGTLLGGLAAFAWSSISWEVIGWHEKTAGLPQRRRSGRGDLLAVSNSALSYQPRQGQRPCHAV
jgi:hypothetical protein